MVDKFALGQVSSEYFGFLCQFSFHRILHTHHLSSEVGTIGQIVAGVPNGLSLTPPQETKKIKNTAYSTVANSLWTDATKLYNTLNGSVSVPSPCFFPIPFTSFPHPGSPRLESQAVLAFQNTKPTGVEAVWLPSCVVLEYINFEAFEFQPGGRLILLTFLHSSSALKITAAIVQ
jgi:hypothetical protein